MAENTFTDYKNRVWCPKIRFKNVSDLEVRRGIDFFHLTTQLIDDIAKQGENADTLTLYMNYGKNVFGGILETTRFIYDCCRDSMGAVTYEGKTVGFDDFFAAIDEHNYIEAQQCAMLALITFFPKGEKVSEGGGSPLGVSGTE
jgi:hypothetical protein